MERPGEKGYVTGAAFLREHPLCQRCYRLTHYGELEPVSVTAEEYQQTLTTALKQSALVLYVVDLFDFNGSLVKGIAPLIASHEVILAINKIDLFPSDIRMGGLRSWVIREAARQGVNAREAIMVSAKTDVGVDELLSLLQQRAKGRPIVVVGMANVGKSSLLNALIKRIDEDEGQVLTTSLFPGTTLGLVNVAVPGGHLTFTDTPGLLGTFRLSDRVCRKSLRDILPQARLKPRVFQLTAGQTLFLGGLARVDFQAGDPQAFVVYTANQLKVHRTKLEKAAELYRQHLGELLTPPCPECSAEIKELRSKKFRFTAGQPLDLVISGLGFLRLSGMAAELVVHVPKAVDVTIRPALIGRKRPSGNRGGTDKWRTLRTSSRS